MQPEQFTTKPHAHFLPTQPEQFVNKHATYMDNDRLKKTKHTQIGEVVGVRMEPSTGTEIS
jgi:hypothetical protein